MRLPFLNECRAICQIALLGGVLFLAACVPAAERPSVEIPTQAAAAMVSTSMPAAAVASPPIAASAFTAVPPSPTFTAVPSLTPLPTPTLSPTLTPTPCPSGEIRTGTFFSGVTEEENKYRIYLPPCYGDGRQYPTLYLFGGNTHDDSAWDDYGMDETAEALIRSGDIPPMLLVMVDGGWIANTTSGGPGSYEDHILNYLIPFIEANYCVWAEPAGRAIGGLSRGGYWSLEIAFRQPEMFVSVGGHSAALIDSHAGPERSPRVTGLANDLGDLRIYLDMGADDYLLPNTLKLHEDMAAQGIPHTWVLNEGAHEDSYWPQHLAEYLLWYGEPWSLDRSSYPVCALEPS